MSEDVTRFTIEDKVAYLTLNRPDRLNALSTEMGQQAMSHLTNAAQDPEIGCGRHSV